MPTETRTSLVSAADATTISESGIRNYSIFLRDGLLFSYFEYVGDDFEADMAAMASDETTRQWRELTDPCQEPVDSAAPGERWADAVEVFRTSGRSEGTRQDSALLD